MQLSRTQVKKSETKLDLVMMGHIPREPSDDGTPFFLGGEAIFVDETTMHLAKISLKQGEFHSEVVSGRYNLTKCMQEQCIS